MKIYTYSQARQQLAKVLDEAFMEGEVRIKRRDGKTFVIRAVVDEGSPLNIEGVDTDVKLDELVDVVRESRESSKDF